MHVPDSWAEWAALIVVAGFICRFIYNAYSLKTTVKKLTDEVYDKETGNQALAMHMKTNSEVTNTRLENICTKIKELKVSIETLTKLLVEAGNK